MTTKQGMRPRPVLTPEELREMSTEDLLVELERVQAEIRELTEYLGRRRAPSSTTA